MPAAPSGAWRLPRGRLGVNALLLAASLYLSLVLNGALWHHALSTLGESLGRQELGILLTLFVTLNLGLLLLLALVSARVLLKPALALLLPVAAACAYFMDAYGVVIDHVMIANLARTDARETGELLTPFFFLYVLGFGIVPAVAVARLEIRRRGALAELGRRLLLLGLVIAAFAASLALDYKGFSLWIRQHRDIRLYANPVAPLLALGEFAHDAASRSRAPRAVVAADAVRAPAASGMPRVVVVVVGEAARAQNSSLLGYERPTNPRLAATAGVVAFSQATACATATVDSLPCMFSRLGRRGFSQARAVAEDNLLDVLQRTGVEVLWRENNSPCKDVCARVPVEDLRHATATPGCGGRPCHDEVLLDGLDQRLAGAAHDQLIVLHLLGSHGPSYFRRYPPAFRRFLPECAQDDVHHCPTESIVNAYDNSLLYTDHVVARAIALLRQHAGRIEPTLLYVSDHGESLGEYGVYLHSLPWLLAPQTQKRIPLVAWSPALDLSCVQSRRDEPASHDNLFHTVLGLFGVGTAEYRKELDLLRDCARRPA